jgi:hypothetical protein
MSACLDRRNPQTAQRKVKQSFLFIRNVGGVWLLIAFALLNFNHFVIARRQMEQRSQQNAESPKN